MTIAEQAASDIARLLQRPPMSQFMLEFEIARIVEDAIEAARDDVWPVFEDSEERAHG